MSEQLSAGQAEGLRQLGPLEGQRIEGGCDHCDAFQTVAPVGPGVWRISVYHAPDCRFLAEHEGRS